jgi:hypothetical protein
MLSPQLLISGLSLILSLVAIGVTYYSFRATHRTSVQPMLVFSNTGKDDRGTDVWFVENVGNGAAVNVVLTGGDTKLNWNKNEVALIPALARGNRMRLGWITSLGALLASYSDVFGRHYTSVCVGNRNTISKGNRYPELEPKWFQYQLPKDKTVIG